MSRGVKPGTVRGPYKPTELRKVPCCFKLPQWLMEWLREQPNQAVLIEKAICKVHHLKPPEVPWSKG